MKWELLLAGPAGKALKRMPAADRRRVLAALDAMEQDPFSGDIVRLKVQPVAWRRRVGELADSLRHRASETTRTRARRYASVAAEAVAAMTAPCSVNAQGRTGETFKRRWGSVPCWVSPFG